MRTIRRTLAIWSVLESAVKTRQNLVDLSVRCQGVLHSQTYLEASGAINGLCRISILLKRDIVTLVHHNVAKIKALALEVILRPYSNSWVSADDFSNQCGNELCLKQLYGGKKEIQDSDTYHRSACQ